MSAEPSPTTSSDTWTNWEHQIVDGRFALRRCLGRSERAAVFVTEHKAKNLAEAAIKLVRADAPQAKTLLVHWQAAIGLSHPHLIQLFEVGRWQSGGHEFLFVVMEYGEQTLAEILRRRALSAEEAQQLLPPVLDALTFLHRRRLVHGQLKPSNLLAVGDQLKLASDTIRPATPDQGVSAAGDVWSLGATLVEALTKRAATSNDQPFDTASLPAGLPTSLLETIQRCLIPTPADRPTVIELRAEYKLPAPTAEPAPPSKPSVQKVARDAAQPKPAPDASRANVPSQPTPSAAPADVQPIPASTTRAAVPPQPAPSASRANVPSQPTLSAAPAYVPLQPVSGTSRAAAPSLPAPGTSRVNVPPQPASSTSREAAPSQPAPSTSRVNVPPQPASGTTREAATPQPALTTSREETPSPSTPERHLLQTAVAIALLLLLAVWGWSRFADKPQPALQPAAVPAPTPVAPPARAKAATSKPAISSPASRAPAQPAAPPSPSENSSAVLHEVLPTVPEKVRNRIQGRVYVSVRVLVDPDGSVVGALMENPGPSKYFARLADQAAREWQFVPADTQSARVLLLRFQFTRGGVAVSTIEQ